jgi:hypothetical protein
VVTGSEAYDVLLGMNVLYPLGIGYDPWEESAWIRPDYAKGLGHKVQLPVRCVAEVRSECVEVHSAIREVPAFNASMDWLVTSGTDLLDGNLHAAQAPPPPLEEPMVDGKVQHFLPLFSACLPLRTSTSTPDPPPPWQDLARLQTTATQLAHTVCSSESVSDERVVSSPTPCISAPVYVHPLDTSVISMPHRHEGIVLVELFGGLATGLRAVLQSGTKVSRYVYVDQDVVARRTAQHHVEQLAAEFPQLLPPSAYARFLTELPQNITHITPTVLQHLGRVDLVVAGWPCQGHSQASGHGQGLHDARSMLFWAVVFLLNWWQANQAEPVAYLLENVHPLSNPTGQRDLQVIRQYVGQEAVVDAAAAGSYAHRLRLIWTNLMPANLLQAAHTYIPSFSDRYVDDILEEGRKSMPVKKSDYAPMAVVNEKGKPRMALPTLMATPQSHAFRQQGPGMIRDVLTGQLSEPTANERERAMGFPTGSTAAPGVTEEQRRQMLGLAMDCNSLTWMLAISFAYQHLDASQQACTLPVSFTPEPLVLNARQPKRLARAKIVTGPSAHAAAVTASSAPGVVDTQEAMRQLVQQHPEVFLREAESEALVNTAPVDEESQALDGFIAPFTQRDRYSLQLHFCKLLCDNGCVGQCQHVADLVARESLVSAFDSAIQHATTDGHITSAAAVLTSGDGPSTSGDKVPPPETP